MSIETISSTKSRLPSADSTIRVPASGARSRAAEEVRR